MINRVILIGNLTRDAETSNGPTTTVTRMRLATNAVWRDSDGNRQESAEFHSVVAFGKLAEICGSYCVKGRRIYIEGRLRTRDYDGQDGLRRHTTEIVAETMKLLDRPHVDDDPAAAPDPEPPTIGATASDDDQTGPAPANGRRTRALASS
ncbi:MAG TPA: single-stranded DNA-binding protein [Candidatus Dormibacteraeota bacterium]